MLAGVNCIISSISSLNQIFNISSASSKTKYFIESTFRLFFLVRWSITLQGVQTTICGSLFKPLNSSNIFCHQYKS
ncbi:MAG: hypothetical protein LBQ24_00640 [Candidatus Peribacteria bacterium]|nr:hypothetical protein [Candidatus Peribacteria bacterium]